MSDLVADIETRNAAEHGLTPAYDRILLCLAADEIKRLRAIIAAYDAFFEEFNHASVVSQKQWQVPVETDVGPMQKGEG